MSQRLEGGLTNSRYFDTIHSTTVFSLTKHKSNFAHAVILCQCDRLQCTLTL